MFFIVRGQILKFLGRIAVSLSPVSFKKLSKKTSHRAEARLIVSVT